MLTSGTIMAIIFVPIGGIVSLVALGFIIAAIRHQSSGYMDDFRLGAGLAGGLGLALGLVMLVPPIVGLSMVNFDSDYMAYKPVSGKVEQIASRQIADGKSMSQRFVFKINGQQYGIDDTRAALVKEGDTVNLNCTREYVWGSTNNGYACNWG
jgi:hypothetical protein